MPLGSIQGKFSDEVGTVLRCVPTFAAVTLDADVMCSQLCPNRNLRHPKPPMDTVTSVEFSDGSGIIAGVTMP